MPQRIETSPDDLLDASDDFERIRDVLRKTAMLMESHGIEFVLLHSKRITGDPIQRMIDAAERIHSDVQATVAARIRGRKTRVEQSADESKKRQGKKK